MKKILCRIITLALMVGLGVVFCLENPSFAEEEPESAGAVGGTSISLSPVSNVLQLSSNSTYNNKFEVKNEGDSNMEIEVYAAPYSYIYSEEEDSYKLGFSKERIRQIEKGSLRKLRSKSNEKDLKHYIQ